jgi:hypothetical protein
VSDQPAQGRLVDVPADARIADHLVREKRRRRTGSALTNVELWRQRVREREHAIAARDPGALEPCPFCEPRPGVLAHPPGRCPSGRDQID